DLDAQDGEILNFQTEHAYPDAGHFPLEVFISTNFDGNEANILSATWEKLNVTTSLDVDPNTWFTWVNSGNIDLSGYSGTAYIAFKYTGSDTLNRNARIHVDNVTVSVP
ncbi:MAG TPA: choice-of-anchor J domain-containing protein, partial [Flavobacteriaceae bacterium]